MRPIMIVLAVLLLLTGVAAAQDDDPEINIEEQAEQVLEEAENLVDFAFNLLGIFEAVSVAITIVGAALGAFGFARLVSAENNLTQARDEVEKEILSIREQFETDLQSRRQEFEDLRGQLLNEMATQRRDASNATLAIALIDFGERQYKFSDFQGAADTYHRALALDNNNPVTYYRLAYVYINSGDLKEAEINLKKSLEIEKDFSPAKAALGFVYRRRGEKMPEGVERTQMLNQAEKWMLDGLQASPKLIDEDGESWWGALGGLYKKRGQLEQAIDAYTRAATVTPNSSYPFGNLAQLYGERNEITKMLQQYERVERLARAEVQAEVGNYWGYFDMLTAQLALGHTEKAEENFVSVLETVPEDAVYAFDILVSTLRQLANILKDYPQSKDLLLFANRVANHKKTQEQEAIGPGDTVTVETVQEQGESENNT